MKKIALISVYDKTGITDFAKSLVDLGWKIIASGGTAKHLQEAGVAVTDVADITGLSPILDHRVVTLSREIHAGLLAKDMSEDRKELDDLKIPFINLVCVDLYPLEEEIAKNTPLPGLPLTKGEERRGSESVLEKTDIGGPTILRSAAKGRRIVICDSEDRIKVLEWLKAGEPDKEKFLNNLRAKAEATVSRYCAASAEYHSGGLYKSIFGKKVLECAYGENAYQKPASLYKNHYSSGVGHLNSGCPTPDALAIHNWELIAGSSLSYNNICDLDRMIQTVTHIGAGFEKNFPLKADQSWAGGIPHIAIGVKHGNACGAAIGETKAEAIKKMLLGDLRAIFGGSVMFNFPIDEALAEILINEFMPEGRRILDVVSAPSFTPEAVEILSRKKGKCRILVNPHIEKAGIDSLDTALRFRYVRGGFLQQPNYTFFPNLSKRHFGNFVPKCLFDIILAWAVGCTSNSNTITIIKEERLYGNGVGQQDRVGAAKLAIFRADEAAQFSFDQHKNSSRLTRQNPTGSDTTQNFHADLQNAVAYSDSFFPFPDALEVLISRGIKTIFSTSGSVNDEKIIEFCKNKGVKLILLPDSEARGFYQH